MSDNILDAIFFAPHPDDGEIFCGGAIAKLSQSYKVGLFDLAEGELASRGSVEDRKRESAAASEILGISHRENLKLPDGFINPNHQTESGLKQLETVVNKIRAHKPKVVFAPYWQGRHPDHVATSELITKACFYSSVKKFSPNSGKAHTPNQVAYYQFRHEFRPSFVMDISDVVEKKIESIRCYQTQIDPEQKDENAAKTLISSRFTLSSIDARDRYFGAMIGVSHAEPFLIKTALPVNDPVSFFDKNPATSALIFPGLE